jgi:lysozyme family protein
MNFNEALEHVLKHEGGFVNHPSDPGGMTNLGVTRAVWEEWVGRESSEKEMRSLTPEMVATPFLMLVLTQVLAGLLSGFRKP